VFAAAVTVAATASLMFVSGAVAATVSTSGTTYVFSADPGEGNDVQFFQDAVSITIHDFNAPVTADAAAIAAGCVQGPPPADPNTVTCPSAGITGVTFNLGDQDDDFDASNDATVTIPQTVNGGDGTEQIATSSRTADLVHGDAGNDSIFGDSFGLPEGGADQLFGDAGNDSIMSGRGNDTSSGGADDDFISGGPDADRITGDAGDDQLTGGPGEGNPANPDSGDDISGGAGIDNARYSDSTSDDALVIQLTLDDVANDGLAGENDNVHSDVEDAQVSAPNPATMTGTAGINSLSGGGGNDTIDAAAGNDFVFANNGNDTVNANDGFADRVECGLGADTANVDEFDQVGQNCETVTRATRGALATEDAPPTASWAAPADQATISTAAANTLTVNAADDKGVTQVVFMAGNRVLCVVTAAPYTCSFKPIDADVGKLTLVAIAYDARQQTATALRQVQVPRFKATKLSAKSTPRRDSTAPFGFTTRGKLTLPAGVTPALGCNGKVTVTFKAGTRTISTRRANLRSDCSYRSKVTFRSLPRLRPSRLRVRVSFGGNAVLGTKQAARHSVRTR
jgi:hypothetical protein